MTQSSYACFVLCKLTDSALIPCKTEGNLLTECQCLLLSSVYIESQTLWFISPFCWKWIWCINLCLKRLPLRGHCICVQVHRAWTRNFLLHVKFSCFLLVLLHDYFTVERLILQEMWSAIGRGRSLETAKRRWSLWANPHPRTYKGTHCHVISKQRWARRKHLFHRRPSWIFSTWRAYSVQVSPTSHLKGFLPPKIPILLRVCKVLIAYAMWKRYIRFPYSLFYLFRIEDGF